MTLIAQLKRHEGFRGRPYKDSLGFWTIGYGHLLSKKTEMSYPDALRLAGGEWTEERAAQVLEDDIFIVRFELRTRLPWMKTLDIVRQDALVNMAFNLGVSGLLKFKQMLVSLQLHEYDKAAAEALDSTWAIQVGRRATELAEQIRTGEY